MEGILPLSDEKQAESAEAIIDYGQALSLRLFYLTAAELGYTL